MLPPPIVEATPAGAALLRAVFADGSVRLFDLTPYTRSPYFAPLAEAAYLAQVRISGGTVTWPDGQDFDRGTIHALGKAPADEVEKAEAPMAPAAEA